jgi:hypothetical protein
MDYLKKPVALPEGFSFWYFPLSWCFSSHLPWLAISPVLIINTNYARIYTDFAALSSISKDDGVAD